LPLLNTISQILNESQLLQINRS